LKNKHKKLVFCVPSGNLGNMTAGLIAKRMGLPIHHFIAATNQNNGVSLYLQTGNFPEKKTVPTISNAMDVSKPSNFVRMQDLYGNDWENMKADISGFYYSDEETRLALNRVEEEQNELLDPHGALGFLAMEAYQKVNPDVYGVVLGTAHPSKFLDVIEPVINRKVEVPERLASLADKEKEAKLMGVDFEGFKDFLLDL
jgi:threonine synthase